MNNSYQQLAFSWSPLDDLLEEIYSHEAATEWCTKFGHPVHDSVLFYTLITQYGYKHEELDRPYIEQWYSNRRYGRKAAV